MVERAGTDEQTAEGNRRRILEETDPRILYVLADVARQLRRMRQRQTTGTVEIFVKQGKVETVTGPDAVRVP